MIPFIRVSCNRCWRQHVLNRCKPTWTNQRCNISHEIILDASQSRRRKRFAREVHHSSNTDVLIRRSSSMKHTSLTIQSMQLRAEEIELVTTRRRLNQDDVRRDIWPMLTECAASNPSDGTEICIEKAKLANRLLELCLKEVDAYRVHLWEWLQANATDQTQAVVSHTVDQPNSSGGDTDKSPSSGVFQQMYSYIFPLEETPTKERYEPENDGYTFSPSNQWKQAPHPSKQMYNLAFSSWKNVIESSHSSSASNLDITEKAARQVSSLLSTMEDDYSSDKEFVKAYNDTADTTKYAPLRVGAALPDITTYGEVMNAWGRCVGSFLRPDKNRKAAKDANFERRLRLEASAMKTIMGLKELMEEEGVQSVPDAADDSNIQSSVHKRPSLDKACYNIILATMARQINPSLAEMRLVIQQMMKRVIHELEHSDTEVNEEDPDSHPSMECFPDVVSYNCLIEARASRAAMFASDMKGKHRNDDDTFRSIVVPHHKWGESLEQRNKPWQHWRQSSDNVSSVENERNFTASEEEAIFAEQILDEMCNLATLPVRPNIWSYNSVIKAWINTESDRGLQRAILILRALTMAKDGGDHRIEEHSSSVLMRLSHWSSTLLSKKADIKDVDGELELDYLAFEAESSKRQEQSPQQQLNFAMNPRMAMFNAAVVGNHASQQRPKEQDRQPIGPLPHIEPDISPDLRSFKMILAALERHGTIQAAKLSEDLVNLLEEQYQHLDPDVSVFNLVLKVWSKAGKKAADPKTAIYSAKRTRHLLEKMLVNGGEAYPRPDESSFLVAINSYVNAATVLVSSGDYPHSVNAAKQADELLSKMMEQPVHSTQIALSCCGAVARTWAELSGIAKFRSKYANHAHSVIEKMVDISNGMSLELLPFNAVLDAWARELALIEQQQNPESIMAKLSKMHDFLLRMIGQHDKPFNIHPDRSSFNHMIRACYAPFGSKSVKFDDAARHQILDLVLETYSEMNASTHHPDAHTYLHLIKAINHIVPNDENNATERFKLFKTMFEDCCDHGHLTKTTFWYSHTTFGNTEEYSDLLHSLTGFNKQQINEINADELYTVLPREWSRFGCRVTSLNKKKAKKAYSGK